MYSSFYKKKNKRKLHKLDRIEEDKIYIEISKEEYNDYNQISIMKKIYELYLKIVKILFNN